MKTIVLSGDEVITAVADRIEQLLRDKPNAVLALPGGRTPVQLYEELGVRCLAGKLSFAEATIFCVADFTGLSADDPRSAKNIILNGLVRRTDASESRCFFPTEENADCYDEMVRSAGGMDLAVLGLGDNAHIGYNEPAVPFDSYTKRRRLTDATKRQNAPVFGGEDQVPEAAVTMGIRTILSARNIIVMATGAEKARAVYKMLYGRDDSVVPAAFLQLHTDVTVYADREAAAEL